ncbi:MAG: hypothetical protein LBV80_05045 [Deltaproteobacteria bacterium]|jgi:uncharacterized protein YhbP (UPF0306 family)|nr:hypothetical protein [Deltaproteobacteria bacterium]
MRPNIISGEVTQAVSPYKTPPEKVVAFLEANHVAGLAMLHPDGNVWASNCFYVYDPGMASLIILTSGKTRHYEAIRFRSAIAGTIAGQVREIRAIQGVQFAACAYEPEGEARSSALRLYYTKFPLARLFPAEVWCLRLETLKFTDNSFMFAHKTAWSRGED